MAHNDSTVSVNTSEENVMQSRSAAEQLAEAQKEINELKKTSISDIHIISEDIASNIIENISGDKLNQSSIKAMIEDVSKKNLGKYL